MGKVAGIMLMLTEMTCKLIGGTRGWSRAEEFEPMMAPPYAGDGMANKKPEPTLVGLTGWILYRLEIPPWGQLLILILLSMIGYGAYFAVSTESHLDRIDANIDAMPAKVALDLLKLGRTAAGTGNIPDASKALEMAATLIQGAAERRVSPPDDFFIQALAELQTLGALYQHTDLYPVVFETTEQLGRYRSALLQPLPHLQLRPIRRLREPIQFLKKQPAISGGAFELMPGIPFISYGGVEPRKFDEMEVVRDVMIKSGTQTLDGFAWIDTEFVGTDITYKGGLVYLSHVRFVNCTFSVVRNPRGGQVLDYAVLIPPKLKIG